MHTENRINVREIRIDKTGSAEKALEECRILAFCGLPRTGKKTAVRMLLEKHPEVHAVFCNIEEIESKTALEKRAGTRTWYLAHLPPERGQGQEPDRCERLRGFLRSMPEEDRILFTVSGKVPESMLDLVWSGDMIVFLPETLWFTQGEIRHYLRACRSRLDSREAAEVTGGWAGFAAMLVRLEQQLGGSWNASGLAARYEIRQYVQTRILSALSGKERKRLGELAGFPRMTVSLARFLWPDWDRERKQTEESLLTKGALRYIPREGSWKIHPALENRGEQVRDPGQNTGDLHLYLRAAAWYEEQGQIQDALDCLWGIQDQDAYLDCLIRNVHRVLFLSYRKIWKEEDLRRPELLYLEWMESALRQDMRRLEELRPLAGQAPAEIRLNMAYGDPSVSTPEWMELLEKETENGEPVRLYSVLGESVSVLSGIRDLSALFSCDRERQKAYRTCWIRGIRDTGERFYDMAEQEYRLQTGLSGKAANEWPKILSRPDRDSPWEIRLGLLYLAYLYGDTLEDDEILGRYMNDLAGSLLTGEAQICRWNTRALLCLREAKRGDREAAIRWLRDTDGDMAGTGEKTRFFLTAEVKVQLLLGNYGKAEELLRALLPYLRLNHSWKWLAEALFQMALIEAGHGREGEAFRILGESLDIGAPWKYAGIYLGYGGKGARLLQRYLQTARPGDPWLEKVAAEAQRRQKRGILPEHSGETGGDYEPLTATERLVLEYLAKGYSNSRISQVMNIRLSTVKSHTYHIYRKLDVSTRIQAAARARECGII